jgi:small subunit ribosomal protein S35
MGEQHPASRKVVLEFSPSDIPDLNPKQTTKLIKLAGPRYNPSLDRVKMSCESFETQAQNKRYLGDLVYKLLKTAKDESTDGFEDVPIDERHVKRKAYHQFPERWKVTPQRRKELEERRVKELEEEEKRRKAGNLVDGVGVIHNALERLGMRDMVEERARGRVGAGGSAKAVRGRVTPGGRSSLFK